MKDFNYYAPTDVVFGRGAEEGPQLRLEEVGAGEAQAQGAAGGDPQGAQSGPAGDNVDEADYTDVDDGKKE